MTESYVRSNISTIFRLNNALIKQKNRKMTRYELTSIQADVLMYILTNAGSKEINQLDIQAVFKLTNPTVSGIIDRLEEKDFVRRVKSLKDARFRKLIPMPKGIEVFESINRIAEESEDELTSGMNEAEKAEFSRLLNIALKSEEE